MTARPPHSVATAGDQPDWSLAGDLCTRPSRCSSTHHSPPQPKPPLSFSSLSVSPSFFHLIIIIILFPLSLFFLFFFLFLPSHLNIFQHPPLPSPSFLSLFFFSFFIFNPFSSLFLLLPLLPTPSPLYSTYPPLSHRLPRGSLPFSSSLPSIYILPRTLSIRIIPVRLWLDLPRCY